MDSIWSKIFLFTLLLLLVLAPFAGFAPLLLVILFAVTVNIVGSTVQILFFGETNIQKKEQKQ